MTVTEKLEAEAARLGEEHARYNNPDLKAPNSEALFREALRHGCAVIFFDVFKYGAQRVWRERGLLPKISKQQGKIPEKL
jgi:hypothetical protein